MADTALILGLAGVAGTIVGTGVGAGIAARSASAVELRREQRAERDEETKLRAAARLVWLDLAQVESNLAWAVMRNRWSVGKVRLPMDAWEAHRDRLAVGITDQETWTTVADAMAVLTHTRGAVASQLGPESELPPGVGESLAQARALVLQAAAALASIAGVHGLQPAPHLE
jgi:hypothetical protein